MMDLRHFHLYLLENILLVTVIWILRDLGIPCQVDPLNAPGGTQPEFGLAWFRRSRETTLGLRLQQSLSGLDLVVKQENEKEEDKNQVECTKENKRKIKRKVRFYLSGGIMSSSQQQTTQVTTPAQNTAPRRRGIVRRTNSGILSKRVSGVNGSNGVEGGAALPTKRRGSYQLLKKTLGSCNNAETENVGGAVSNADASDVASVSSADEVQTLDSPELKQTHWEQFGTAQVIVFSASADEELMSFYDQALSAEGYDILCVEEADELNSILKNQKVEPDLLLFLCNTFSMDEQKILVGLRGVVGHTPILALSSEEGDEQLALTHASEYLKHTEDVDELVVKINVQLRKRHQAKLQIESMIEQAQKLLTKASLKRSTLYTLSEEESEGSESEPKESTLLTQRQQVKQGGYERIWKLLDCGKCRRKISEVEL
eukprot:TRINITY_DN9572_c0_g1_i5.p1 TRINITY_DN9572_c0_g1~~TRINITY_DN9572_c0_g1_i5.p1  ORF type:complete len:429 (+),score=74.56 TRINITY_DN9572_c0_g1_i5:33-1319(+)